MKRPQFWYVPPCCRRFRAPAPSPPACASRPPSPPRPLWRSAPSGTLSGGKGGSHRQPPCGRTAHLRLCARGQFRLFAPARVSLFPSRGLRAAARWLAGVRRAAARRQPSNHPSPRTIGVPGCGPSAGAARACALRRASAAAPPLPPASLRALRSAPPVCVRSARARNPAPLRARVGVFGLAVGRFASGARAAFAAGALCGGCVLCGSSGGLFRLLVPRRSCASAEAALVRSGALRAPRGLRGHGGHVLRPPHPRPLPRPAVGRAPGLCRRASPGGSTSRRPDG